MNKKINPEWEALQDKPHFVPLCCTPEYVKLLEKLIREHNLAVEALTEKQLVEAFRQALECGDFVKYVRVDTNAQNIVYLPFEGQQRLEARIRELEAEIEILSDYDDPRD